MPNIPSVPIQSPTHSGSPTQPTLTRPWQIFFQRVQTALNTPDGWYAVPVVVGNALVDLSFGSKQEVTITGATNINPPLNGSVGQTFMLMLVQDNTGGHAITFDPSYVDVTKPSAFSGVNGPANTRVTLNCTIRPDQSIILTAPTWGPVPVNP